jgi:hypothetical protein
MLSNRRGLLSTPISELEPYDFNIQIACIFLTRAQVVYKHLITPK